AFASAACLSHCHESLKAVTCQSEEKTTTRGEAMQLVAAEHVTPSDMVWLAKGAIRTGTMGPEKLLPL
ncbi:MAG: hypothetical protein DMG72_20305, partial [Acidobacteria bacterium]